MAHWIVCPISAAELPLLHRFYEVTTILANLKALLFCASIHEWKLSITICTHHAKPIRIFLYPTPLLNARI